MENNVHNPTDKAVRNIASEYADPLVLRLGIKLKVVNVLNTKALNSDFKDREMDCLLELENNVALIIEIQSSKITREKAYSLIEYIKYVEDKYGKDVILGIIFANNEKNIEAEEFFPNPQIKITPYVYSFKDEDGDKILNNLKKRIKNNEILTMEEKADLALLSLYSTKRSSDELAKESAILVSQIRNLSKKEIEKIANPILMIINKTVKSKQVRKEIRECLKMQQVSVLREEREEGKEEGLKEGKEEGLKEGKEEGLKEGKEEERKFFVNKLRENGLSVKEIMDISELPEETINSLLIV